jgi:glycosyltransferase involved in cell wall biosynthesis
MKLLITTQVVDKDDPTLGFFHRWIEEFARHCESIEVICLKEGRHDLPANVHVHSLGKEKGDNSSFTYGIRFKILSWKLQNKYDAVFVHMNPEYIVLEGFMWRLLGKKIGLWYLHKSVTLRLRIAELLTNVIFTASTESFRLQTKKLKIVGHGIDLSQFKAADREKQDEMQIITTGRVAPAKRVKEMLGVLDILHARHIPFHFTIAGGPGTPDDHAYAEALKKMIAQTPYHAHVSFLGAISHDEIPRLLANSDLFINLSTTGSMDKAVLEAFASEVPVVSSNEAFRTILEPLGLFIAFAPEGLLDSEKIADALVRAWGMDPKPFRKYVEEKHSLETLIPRILELLQAKTV